MNPTIKKSLEQESTSELFFYFKLDGDNNFEKKLMAGKILHERGFDTQILQKEKLLTMAELQADLMDGETPGYLLNKSKKEVLKKPFSLIIFLVLYLLLRAYDILTEQEINWESFGIICAIGLIVLSYSIVSYKKNVNKLMHEGAKNNELLRLRLSYIQKEWDF
ncbi:hypothetical protein [Marinifilum fragile]|uniref:hypothetical protein n=1 Tax=Marinifilum fragile TaxID=570161 RepID=UPI002AA640A5|nr:hypothetical protein [Marinifilum fragile]